MRVALVCPYDLDRPGGVQDQVFALSRWLADAGHRGTVIGPGTDAAGDPPAGGAPPPVRLGPTVVFPANRSAAPISIDPRTVGALRRAMSGVDVVHIHEPLMPLVGPAALLGTDRPTVVTFHADPSTAVRRLYRVAGPLVRRALRRTGVVTAVSPVAAAGLGTVAARVIPNGIDVEAHRTGRPRHPRRVVFVGRDDPRKGLALLLDAWDEVALRVPDAELVVVGAGARAGVPRSVRFLGRVDDDEKRRTLGSASVLCAPNTGGESFGIVLVEAMAAGCAVVASAIPGFVHVLDGAGSLVPPGDVSELAETLVETLIDGNRVAAMRERSRARAAAYDRGPVLDAYLDAYRTAIAARRL